MEVVLFQRNPAEHGMWPGFVRSHNRAFISLNHRFRSENRQLKRAGMDYWSMLRWNRWKIRNPSRFHGGRKFWFVESEGPQRYDEVDFGKDDFGFWSRILRSAFELA